MIETRADFPQLIDSLGCKTAAEIGVAAGNFSRVLLCAHVDRLWLCDIWNNPNDVAAGYRDQTLAVAASDPRVEVVEKPSVEFAASLPDGAIDFVYIDTQHGYEFIREDLEAWWPKTRLCLAGHDYVFWNSCANAPCGVVLAVEEFAESRDLEIHVTGVDGTRIAQRLKAAHDAAAIADPGPWADRFPSFYLLKSRG